MTVSTRLKSGTATYLQGVFQESLAFLGSFMPSVEKWRARRAEQYLQSAQKEYEANRLRETIQYLEKSEKWSAKKADVFASLGLIYGQMGDREKAKRHYNLALLDSFQRDGGSNFRALRALGVMFHEDGDYREALYHYLKALEHPEGGSDDGLLGNLGALYLDMGKIDESIEYSRRAEAINPKNPIVLENLGRAFNSIGKLDEALKYLKRSVDADPENWEAYRQISIAYRAKGDLGKALDNLDDTLRRAPNNPDILYDLSILLDEKGDRARAAEAAKAAASGYEQNGNIERQAFAHWQLGWSLYNVGDFEGSKEASRRAVELRPALFAARFNLGLALVRLGNLEMAKLEYEQGLSSVQDASDIKFYAIEDLLKVKQEAPNLKVGPILEMLESKYKALTEQLQATSVAPLP